MNQMLNKGRHLLQMPEFWSSVGLVLWAVHVMAQPNNLNREPNYSVLTSVISPHSLQLAALCIGLAQMATAVWNSRWPRVATAFLAADLWCILAHGLALSDQSAPGVVCYLTLGSQDVAMMTLLVCRRIGPRR